MSDNFTKDVKEDFKKSKGARYTSYMPSEAKRDTVGIDLEKITGQFKLNLWDLLRDRMDKYLSGNKYSEDKFKSFLEGRGFRIPIDLPKDYGIDLDFNRPSEAGGRESRITLKKNF